MVAPVPITVAININGGESGGGYAYTAGIPGRIEPSSFSVSHHFTCRGYQRCSEGSAWAVHRLLPSGAGDGFGQGTAHKLTPDFGHASLTRNEYDYVALNFAGGRGFPVRFILHCCRCR